MNIYHLVRNILYRLIWFLEKKLKSELYLGNSRTIVDMQPENSFSENYINFITSLKNKLIVRAGPFNGLQYPDSISFGSSLYPKLIGSYEIELEQYILDFINKKYNNIYVIGCAEGYYCNGLGIKSANSNIYCFDISGDAVKTCNNMSKINNLKNVTSVNERFNLSSFEPSISGETLIICDIEGAEASLFEEHEIKKLKSVDLLIEVHDFQNVGLTKIFISLFNKTHKIKQVFSVDDLYRPMVYESREFTPHNLTYNENYRLMKEYRKAQMSWVILKAL
jgi:hypothetical protein